MKTYIIYIGLRYNTKSHHFNTIVDALSFTLRYEVVGIPVSFLIVKI